MRLLVVEDDPAIASFLVKGLRQEGFAVDCAAGNSAFDLATTEPYDAAIVDLMLPKMDGLTLIEALRRHGISTPMLILSAKLRWTSG